MVCGNERRPTASFLAMNARSLFCLGCLVGGLLASGCVRIATAPLRAEREEKAAAAFARLAQASPETIAAWLDQRMTSQLGLTPEQQPKIGAINLKYARQLHALAVAPDSARSKAWTLRRQSQAKAEELKGILTPAQFSRFEEMKDEL